jgi:hypothetical protein
VSKSSPKCYHFFGLQKLQRASKSSPMGKISLNLVTLFVVVALGKKAKVFVPKIIFDTISSIIYVFLLLCLSLLGKIS